MDLQAKSTSITIFIITFVKQNIINFWALMPQGVRFKEKTGSRS